MGRLKTALLVIAASGAVGAQAANPILAEIEIEAATRLELDAGVWLDDQYVGYVRDLQGKGKLVTLPGEHRLRFQLIGFEDVERTVVVEPGEEKRYRLRMLEDTEASYPEKAETARIKLDVEPDEAVVFVDGKFVGPVERFDGRGIRMAPGTYDFTVALPGYQAFETQMTVTAGQTYELKTKLGRAGISEQADELTAGPVSQD